MIEALVAGKMIAQAVQKDSTKGMPYTLARVAADSHTEDSVTVSVIAFEHDAQEALLQLTKGDHVTLSGKASPKLWKDKQGISHTNLEMVAHKVMTVYDARPAKVLTQERKQWKDYLQ